jgi:hypothetical protein
MRRTAYERALARTSRPSPSSRSSASRSGVRDICRRSASRPSISTSPPLSSRCRIRRRTTSWARSVRFFGESVSGAPAAAASLGGLARVAAAVARGVVFRVVPGFFAGARAVDLVATEDFILFVYKLCAIAEAEAYDSRAAVWRDVKKAHVECAPRAMYGKSLT